LATFINKVSKEANHIKTQRRTIMAILDPIKKWVRHKRSIEDISVDELRREKIRLEQEEAKMARQVEDLETQKQQLFLKGKDEASARQQRILATKIKELDVQARNLDKNLRFVSKQLRIINGFLQIKENQRLFQEAGVSGLISKIDLQTLQRYVEEASIEGVFQLDKFQDILGTLEETEKIVGVVEEDKDILDIMRAMQEAKLAEMERPEAVDELARQRLDEILHREEPEAGV